MKSFYLEDTPDTPKVILDAKNGIFELSGRSLPEDGYSFYQPIIAWFKGYAQHPNQETQLHLKYEYFNSAYPTYNQEIIGILEQLPNAKIIWYYQEDDEEMKQAGEEFEEISNIIFEFKSYS